MKRLSVVVSQSPFPEPRAVTHDCGSPAVEVSYPSARVGGVARVVICSACNPTFYANAARRLHAAAKGAAA